MIVQEVRKLKKNYQVTFTNGYKLAIDEDTLVSFRLRPGLEIESLEDIEKSIEKNKLFLKALKFASYGKSENQVIQYLNEQGMQNTYDTIMKLRKFRAIDDYRMIRNLQNKGYSYLKLEERLKYYQFDQKDIDQALLNYNEKIPLYKEFKVGLKKYAKETDYKKRQQKLYRYLISKGFSEANVMSVMRID